MRIRVESWTRENGEEFIKSQGGRMSAGDGYRSDFFVVHPVGDLVKPGKSVTLKMKASEGKFASFLCFLMLLGHYELFLSSSFKIVNGFLCQYYTFVLRALTLY